MTTKIGNRRVGGKQLLGAAITVGETSNEFIGVTTLGDLIMFGLIRPSRNEKATVKDFKNDEDGRMLQSAHTVREQVQRRFDKNRMERAHKYANYIESLHNGARVGGTPPITLFCPSEGRIDEQGFILTLPSTSPLVNLDGETQTEARFILRDRDPATAEDLPIRFVLYHGIEQDHAGAIMHDFNKYAHPVRETAIAPLHPTGPLSAIVIEALNLLNIDRKEVQRFKAKPRKNELVSFECLLAAAAGSSVGLSGPSLVASISHLNNGDNNIDHEKAIEFLKHAIPLAGESREQVAMSSPQVWGLMAGIHREYGKLVTADEWSQAAGAYNAKIEERGIAGMRKKRAAALNTLNIVKAEN